MDVLILFTMSLTGLERRIAASTYNRRYAKAIQYHIPRRRFIHERWLFVVELDNVRTFETETALSSTRRKDRLSHVISSFFSFSLSCVSAGEMLSHKRNKTVQERKGRERKKRKGSFSVSSVLLFYTPFLACKGAKKTQPNPRARDAPIPPPTAHCLAVFTLFLVRSRRPIDHAFRVEGKAAGRRRPKSAHLFFGGGGREKK